MSSTSKATWWRRWTSPLDEALDYARASRLQRLYERVAYGEHPFHKPGARLWRMAREAEEALEAIDHGWLAVGEGNMVDLLMPQQPASIVASEYLQRLPGKYLIFHTRSTLARHIPPAPGESPHGAHAPAPEREDVDGTGPGLQGGGDAPASIRTVAGQRDLPHEVVRQELGRLGRLLELPPR